MLLNKKKFYKCIVLFVLSILLNINCATKTPIKLDPSFHEKKIRSVALLPVIDRRSDKSFEVDIDKKIRVPAKEELEKKGYSVSLPAKISDVAELYGNDWNSLVPKDYNTAIVIVYLNQLYKHVGFWEFKEGRSLNAEMILKSVDSNEKRVVLWEDRDDWCYHSSGWGCWGGAWGSPLDLALGHLFKTLPKVRN
jgi:hypothetical protein